MDAHTEVLPAWSDTLTCTLGAVDVRTRAEAFGAVFHHLLSSTRFEDGFRWTFHNAPGVERQVRELARAEHACCPFLTFAISVRGDQLVWHACGPANAEAAVELFYRLPELTDRSVPLRTLAT
jgi:hypothetical protein